MQRFEGSPWRVALPLAALLLLVYFGILATDSSSRMAEVTSLPRLVGTMLMFSLLPVYLVSMMIVLWFQTDRVLHSLAPIAAADDLARSRACLHRVGGLAVVLIPISIVFGVWQNRGLLGGMAERNAYALLDIAVLFGNCVVWAVVGLLIAWTIPLSRSISRLGRFLQVDLYRLDQVRPLGRLATYSVLTVAGSMAFMPLQSLDARFRWENYEAGVIVGVPAAITLFLLPLWGVRDNIRARKSARLTELHERLDAVPRHDVVQLETVTSHVERIRNLPHWPLDVGQLLRVLGYIIIPPLAWVGAALVENLVDQFTG